MSPDHTFVIVGAGPAGATAAGRPEDCVGFSDLAVIGRCRWASLWCRWIEVADGGRSFVEEDAQWT